MSDLRTTVTNTRRARRNQPVHEINGHVSYRLHGDALDDALARVTSHFGSTGEPTRIGVSPRNADVYEPRGNQLVPKSGAWGMITRDLPAIEGNIDEHITAGRVFYLEHAAHADHEGFHPDGKYKVLTHSPWGDVWLWPYEYVCISPAVIIELWTEGALTFHPINVQLGAYNAVVFYARSRGIALADAAVMALGTMSAPVGWFDPNDEIRDFVEGFANVGVLTPENHRRRQAAQAKKAADHDN